MMNEPVETLRWRGGRLEMIDQRVLPARFEYITYSDAVQVAEGIRSMVVRGAPAIGCAAAYGVALEALARQAAPRAEFDAAMQAAFAMLASSRPTAVNLFWAIKRMQRLYAALLIQALSNAQIAEALLAEAHAVTAEDIRINRAMGAHGAALLADGARVLTHCNAGALATAGYGTALGVIRAAWEQGKRIQVIADETRPVLQGARLTAWELMQDQIPVTLITDNMAGALMRQGKIQLCVVGADRIAANGDVANKIGTYSVAVLARAHNIPFYVAAPYSTIDLQTQSGADIPIEARNPLEVTAIHGSHPIAPPGVAVLNPAFDVTPASLITGIITERGVFRPGDLAAHFRS
jgi:methylthioribose-1-phosphate isomerase